eukprot:TRINITY_DN11600_c0_g1_i1.p1 TRINITY_DN11600_c0_g1~~TRINITY_DN11600_c0_g1_i1.p1  ORF type:complete len:163 (-),score=48.43 TRINITY_DN11600_c0_g1_i1:77-565(-)
MEGTRDPRAGAAKRELEEIVRTVLAQPGAKIRYDPSDEGFLVKEEITNVVNGMVDSVGLAKTNQSLKAFQYEEFVRIGREVAQAVRKLGSLLGDNNQEVESKVLLLARHFLDAMKGLVDAICEWNVRADEKNTRTLQTERNRFVGLVKTMNSAMDSIEREYQ